MAVKALLFDMDGLMVDSEPLWFEVERAFCHARGGEWTHELAHLCVGQGLVNTLRVMRERFGFELDDAQAMEEIFDSFVRGVGALALKPGLLEILGASRLPMAVASSSSRRLVHAVLDRFSLRARFGAVVSGDDVTNPKPAPDIFLEAARRLGFDAKDTVVLEDSPAGVRAGRAAGALVIAVPERAPELFDGVAHHVVKDLFEARRLLF